MKNCIIIFIEVMLVGLWFFLDSKKILRDSSPTPQFGNIFRTNNTNFATSDTKVPSESISMQYKSALPRHYGTPPVSSTPHKEMFHNTFSAVQSSGARTLYSTASVSLHSYGSGSGSPMGGGQNTTRVNQGTPYVNSSQVGNLHTFIAMSSDVRNTADEFGDGENAIGSDSPNGVIRRTPGSGPVTEDPEHQPTVVESAPIGDGVYFVMLLAIGYLFWKPCRKSQESIIL